MIRTVSPGLTIPAKKLKGGRENGVGERRDEE